MDRSENPKRPREAADEPRVGRLDATLPSITSHEASSIPQGDASKPIGARPRSEVTAHHDAGSGANETVDGLTSAEEAIRRGAEETPVGNLDTELEDLPVFDRGQAPPKA